MHRLKWIGIVCATFVLAAALGCRLQPFAPGDGTISVSGETTASSPNELDANASSRSGFYPLTIGNRWRYRLSSNSRWRDSTGTPHEFQTVESLEREIVCIAPVGPLVYSAERTIDLNDLQAPPSYLYYRQDRNGLYELDGATPPCAPPVSSIASRAGVTPAAEIGHRPTDRAVLATLAALEHRMALIIVWPAELENVSDV